jgi:hypothetical protein
MMNEDLEHLASPLPTSPARGEVLDRVCDWARCSGPAPSPLRGGVGRGAVGIRAANPSQISSANTSTCAPAAASSSIFQAAGSSPPMTTTRLP